MDVRNSRSHRHRPLAAATSCMLLRMQAWHNARQMHAHADDIAVQRYGPV